MISVVYAVHNEEKNLALSLESVNDWVGEIVVVDGESTDATLEIAKQYQAKIIKTTNKANFHINKQMAIDAAEGDLILQLDADEVVDGQLKNFILKIAQEKQKELAAWNIKRKNLFLRTWLRKGGQYPDMVIRLFWRGQAYLPQKDVHEQMKVTGKVGVADGHILHYANPDLESYWRKFNTYTSFKAQQLSDAAVPLNFRNYCVYFLFKPTTTFLSLYLRHRGYIDGLAGFLFALFSGWHHLVAFAKYAESKRVLPVNKVRVFFPESPFAREQKHRGVGRYGQWLIENLQMNQELEVVENRSDAQVVHYTFFDLFVKSLKKVRKDQKLMITIHDSIPLIFPKDYPVGLRGKLKFQSQKRLARKANLIVTDSQSSKNDIVRLLKIKPQKVEIVPLAANPELESATLKQVTKVRKAYALPLNYLLYVGDINFNKNLAQLIKSLKFLPEKYQLVLVGKNFVPQDIPEWRMIEEQITLSEVDKRVKFLANVNNNADLSAIYTGAQVYIQPSYYEGFGLPVLEAMRCKTPVVLQGNSSLKEIGDKYVFYSESLQAFDFAQAIEKVLALSDNERKHWIEAAYQWESQFTWDKTATMMTELYEKLAS